MNMKKTLLIVGLSIGLGVQSNAFASPEMMGKMMNSPSQKLLERDSKLAKMATLDICVGYASLTDEKQKQAYIEELDIRSQLSDKDYKNIKTGTVENSMTSCGMYMVLGKPIAEQARQIRPMTFKAVHVYPTKYFVTQSGMVVGSHERKEGQMPPSLIVDKPKVEAPPVQY
jgi:hypothetical protein